MREDYKIKSSVSKVEFEVEREVLDKLRNMEKFTKITCSELANTALKRFISQHKDFLPPKEEKPRA